MGLRKEFRMVLLKGSVDYCPLCGNVNLSVTEGGKVVEYGIKKEVIKHCIVDCHDCGIRTFVSWNIDK